MKKLPVIVPSPSQQLESIPDPIVREQILKFIGMASAESTKRTYLAHYKRFTDWLGKKNYSLPAEPWQVAEYMIEQMQTRIELEDQPFSIATLSGWLTAISLGHLSNEYLDPTKNILVQKVFEGLKRVYGQPQHQALPLYKNDILKMIRTSSGNPTIDVRDACLIVLGFTGGFRTDELVKTRDRPGIDCQNIQQIQFDDVDGYVITIPKSKTDQYGHGRQVYIPRQGKELSPAAVLENWLSVIQYGQLFRSVTKNENLGESLSDRAVREIVKTRAMKAGIKNWPQVSGHSLRRGFVNSARKHGFDHKEIAKQTGQTSQTINRYIEDMDLFVRNPALKLF